MEQARGFLKKIIELIKKPELRILPGQLAFFLVLSIIPLIALIGAIASFLSIPTDTIKVTIGSSVPKEIAEIVYNIISGQGLNFNMTAFLVIAFILASNGTHSMIITSNEIYRIKSDNIIKRRIKAILMTFILMLLFLALLVIPIWGDTIFEIIFAVTDNKLSIDLIYQGFRLIQYPLIIVILYFNIKLLYVTSPDEKIEGVTTRKGALFTTIGWIIASEIYSFYISTFSNYDLFYGSLSNVAILILWVYILSYIFVLGMIINAGTYQEKELQKKINHQEKLEELEKTKRQAL